MKLVMLLLVKDEIDIVRENIEFHLAHGVDHVIATDNNSKDGTREVLSDYARLGVATVIDEAGQDFSQAKWMTRAALMARDDFGADWILPNDADEFWVSPDGNLKADLQSTTAHVHACSRMHMFAPYDELGQAPWFDHLVYRVKTPKTNQKLLDIYGDELTWPYLYFDLPPKVLIRGEGLAFVRQGNHSAVFDREVMVKDSDVVVYHFPLRSRAQFEEKIRNGGNAYLLNKDLPQSTGWHWRRWYRMIQLHGADRVLSEVVPSAERLRREVCAGMVVKDLAIKELLNKMNC